MHIFSCYELNINKPKCKPNCIIIVYVLGHFIYSNRLRMIYSTIYIFQFYARTHLNNHYYLNLLHVPLEYQNAYR